MAVMILCVASLAVRAQAVPSRAGVKPAPRKQVSGKGCPPKVETCPKTLIKKLGWYAGGEKNWLQHDHDMMMVVI